ncbi:MAG: DNA polymerase III subunit delta [Candidatus Marinimicrobia bacterium]|nr:DNA polymerase III subunit delta [Candidatus Neomarinimicrobiota bacterium]
MPGIVLASHYGVSSTSDMAAYTQQSTGYTQIITDLHQGKLATFYFAKGSDFYLYRQFVTELRSAFRSRFGDNAEYVQRWGVDLKAAADVSSLIGGGSLFSSASLVVLHEIQDAGVTVKTNLAKLLEKLAPDTIVLAHYSVSDYRKAKWLTAVQDMAQVVALHSPETRALPGFVTNMASQYGLDLDESAIYRLIELSRGELAIIDNELEKLALFLNDPAQTIGRELVNQVAGAVENAQVGQFVEALSNRDRETAIHTLVEIHHQGKEGLPYLVAVLYNRLIQLMALRETPDARKAIGQGITSYYFLKDLQSVSGKYSMAELQKATRELAILDLQFRLGSLDMLAAFSSWVSKVV